MIKRIKSFFDFISKMFKGKKHIKLGIYGPPNAGKSSIANMVVKYRENPDLMAKKLADKYGFTIIPPEK